MLSFQNLPRSESFRFSTPFSAFLRAILSLLLPLGIRFERVLPPDVLLFRTNLSHEAKRFAVRNLVRPSGPISLIIDKIVEWLTLGTLYKSTSLKYWKAAMFTSRPITKFLWLLLNGFSSGIPMVESLIVSSRNAVICWLHFSIWSRKNWYLSNSWTSSKI